MKIAFIDIDEIFWKAFNNIRYFDVLNFISDLQQKEKHDKIYCMADFTSKDYLKTTLESLIKAKQNYPIEIIDGYSQTEKRNLTDILLINMFYQDFIKQENIDENTYTIATASKKYFNMIKFVESIGGNKVNLVVANNIEYHERISESFNVIMEIDISKEKMDIFDKTVIKEIIRSTKWGEDNRHWMTIKNLIENCRKMSNIDIKRTEYMLHAMISLGYLEKKILINKDDPNIKYKVVVCGPEDKIAQLLG